MNNMQSNKQIFSWRDQLIYGTMTALATTALLIAGGLQPAAQGFGTHEQLGLSPCAFLRLTGFPCPGCGMTTCFAHAAKFHFIEAASTQPMGLLLFFLTVLFIPTALYLLQSRIPVKSILHSSIVRRSLPIWAVLYLLGWAYKLALMWH